jgi:hypothetical protein
MAASIVRMSAASQCTVSPEIPDAENFWPIGRQDVLEICAEESIQKLANCCRFPSKTCRDYRKKMPADGQDQERRDLWLILEPGREHEFSRTRHPRGRF